MEWLIILPVYLIVPFLIGWGTGCSEVTDYTVPTFPRKNLLQFKRVLIIHPHADDEVLSSGGLTQILARMGIPTTLLILTKGEKGTDDAHLQLELKETRAEEARIVAKLIGIKKVLQHDLGDGEVKKHSDQAQKIILETIEKEEPDLVISYDLAGMYGHEDHITTAVITTDVIKKHFPTITHWYTALPKKILDKMKLPEHMAKDHEYFKKRAIPSHKVYIGRRTMNKIRGVYAYKSQFGSFKRSRPVKFLPVWFMLSLSLYEYYYEVPHSN